MNIKLTRTLTAMSSILMSLFLGWPSSGAIANQGPIATAARRSLNAAKTINLVTGLPDDAAIPLELFNRAHAIGVFPDVAKFTVLFSQGMKGMA